MKLNETNYINNPFFKYCHDNHLLSFLGDDYEAIDNSYYYGHSCYKDLSVMMETLLDLDESTAFSKAFQSILAKYKKKWEKVYSALFGEYDPLNDYDIHEKENVGSKVTTTGDSSAYGFNSSTSSPLSDTSTTTEGEKTDNERELSRSGKMGGHTSQELIDSELSLRDKWNFYEMIYKDMDSTLCSLYIR